MRNKGFILVFCLIFFLINGKAQETWSPVGSGYFGIPSGSTVQTFKVISNKLYVGGGFNTTGSIIANSIVIWDGINWDTLGSGVDGSVFSIEIYNNEIYVGGTVRMPVDVWPPEYRNIARWNGNNWNRVGNKQPNSDVKAIRYKNDLYIGGSFINLTDTNGFNTQVRNIASLDSSAWNTVGGGVGSGGVPEIDAMDEYNNELIVAGRFTCVGPQSNCDWSGYYNIARWNGTQWLKLDSGLSDMVYALAVDTINNILYVGGSFKETGNWNGTPQPMKYIARWDGNNWQALPGDSIFSNSILSLKFYHGYLYAGYACGNTEFYRFDGRKWQKVTDLNCGVAAMEVYQDELYVGGGFYEVNGDSSMRFLAKFTTPNYCNNIWVKIYTTEDTIKLTGGAPLQLNAYGYANQWEWDWGDSKKDTTQNGVHQYDSNGIFTVKLRATFGFCPWETDSVIVQVEGVGIKVASTGSATLMQIYPNPTKGSFVIEVKSHETEGKSHKVEIYDIKGVKVHQSEIRSSKLEITTQGWAKGSYFINLVKEGKVLAREKVVVE